MRMLILFSCDNLETTIPFFCSVRLTWQFNCSFGITENLIIRQTLVLVLRFSALFLIDLMHNDGFYSFLLIFFFLFTFYCPQCNNSKQDRNLTLMILMWLVFLPWMSQIKCIIKCFILITFLAGTLAILSSLLAPFPNRGHEVYRRTMAVWLYSASILTKQTQMYDYISCCLVCCSDVTIKLLDPIATTSKRKWIGLLAWQLSAFLFLRQTSMCIRLLGLVQPPFSFT